MALPTNAVYNSTFSAAANVLPAFAARQRLQLQSDPDNTAVIDITTDGTDPSSTNYRYSLAIGQLMILTGVEVPDGQIRATPRSGTQRLSAEDA